MRLDVRIRKGAEKINTTQFELLGESPAMKDFYINSEGLTLLPFDTEELVLSISSQAFADGEVALAIPPLPFFKEFARVVRYEHRIERRGKERRAPSTPDLFVTLAYVNKADLEEQFVADRLPIFFGLSPVTEAAAETQKPAVIETAAEPVAHVAVTFDAFLRERVRVQRDGRLTSRQIWAVWAARWSADPDDDLIAGIRFADVSRRFRGVFGATAATNPTRIDGILQRYWPGYRI